MADELKPCPFCEDGGYVHHISEGWDRGKTVCGNCGCVSSEWQSRPIESALLSRAEAAEALAETAAKELRAALDAYEGAEAKVEKVKAMCHDRVKSPYADEWSHDRGMRDFAVAVLNVINGTFLDAILAPGGES